MNPEEQSKREFGTYIQKLINKEDLTREQSYDLFCELLEDRQPDLQQGAFLAALTSKRETSMELAGAWDAILKHDTVQVSNDLGSPLVENSGTGMDIANTFNVSTAAGVVASAAGVRMARHGARALSSSCGTVDLLEAVGVCVECEVHQVEESILKTDIGLFNGMSSQVHPKSLSRILAQIRFGSTLNIAASLASPCKPSHALRGVYTTDMIPEVAGFMKEIGFVRAMVVHGFDADRQKGMDELSILGESVVCEIFEDRSHYTYMITPEEVGLPRYEYDDIRALDNIRQEAIRFLQVISGMGHQACQDFTCFNTAPIFYMIGKVDSMTEGVDLARETIKSGRAIEKLQEWVNVQCDRQKKGLDVLSGVAKAAGVPLV